MYYRRSELLVQIAQYVANINRRLFHNRLGQRSAALHQRAQGIAVDIFENQIAAMILHETIEHLNYEWMIDAAQDLRFAVQQLVMFFLEHSAAMHRQNVFFEN